MAYIRSYKDLIVWQKAMELAKAIFELTAYFPKSELYGLVAQMRRAVVSIVSNIAEGYGRKSRKEYSQFYAIAYGSALELETQLILSKALKMAPEEKFEKSEKILLEVLKMLNYFTNKLEARR
jgi:four helix bundle protein